MLLISSGKSTKVNGYLDRTVLQLKKALENLGLVEKPSTRIKHAERLPTEIQPFEEAFLYKEGLATRVMVNRYERNQRARLECIRHQGSLLFGSD